MEKIKDWLTMVVSGLVSNPDKVKIEVINDEQGVLYTVSVAKEDAGKVIGKKGAIAEALRVLLRSAGYMENVRASMKVDAPGSTFKLGQSVPEEY